jgi:hypothetical protein
MTRSRDRKVFVEEKVKEYRINKGVAEPKSGEARPKSKSVYTDQIEAAGNYSVPLLDSLQQHPVLVSPEVFGKTSSSSMKRASELLYVDPNNAKARLLLESAYFDQGDMEGFLRVSRESLLRGGEVVARLVHQDRGQFHLSALVCTPTHIYFVPTPSPDCGLPSTAVPLNRIEEIRVENDKVQGTFLRIRLRSGAVLGRPSENRLWILGSHKERRQVAYGKGFLILTEQNVIVSPSQAQGILETVATLLRQAVSPTP